MHGSDQSIIGSMLESKFDSRQEKMTAGIHDIKLLMEVQDARNRIALEGLTVYRAKLASEHSG